MHAIKNEKVDAISHFVLHSDQQFWDALAEEEAKIFKRFLALCSNRISISNELADKVYRIISK